MCQDEAPICAFYNYKYMHPVLNGLYTFVALAALHSID